MPGDRKREFGHGRAVDSLYNGEDDDNGDDDDGENGAPVGTAFLLQRGSLPQESKNRFGLEFHHHPLSDVRAAHL